MAKQVYYEDVEVGMELPMLTKNPTTQQLVMYAGASGDFYQIHYDKDFAQGNGLPGVILHGLLKAGFVGQLVTDWIGEGGTIKKLGVSYRGMDQPGVPLYVKGVVTNKYIKNGEGYVEADVWTENQQGQKTTPGTTTVILPRKKR